MQEWDSLQLPYRKPCMRFRGPKHSLWKFMKASLILLTTIYNAAHCKITTVAKGCYSGYQHNVKCICKDLTCERQ